MIIVIITVRIIEVPIFTPHSPRSRLEAGPGSQDSGPVQALEMHGHCKGGVSPSLHVSLEIEV